VDPKSGKKWTLEGENFYDEYDGTSKILYLKMLRL